MGQHGKLQLVNHETPGTIAGTATAVAPKAAPKKPAGVAADEELSVLWDEVVPELDASGLLSPADVVALEVMLRHTLLVRMAHREILATGKVVVPASGNEVEKKHPAEAILRLESAAVQGWADKLGMTWMSRARTQLPARKDKSDSPFAAPAATG